MLVPVAEVRGGGIGDVCRGTISPINGVLWAGMWEASSKRFLAFSKKREDKPAPFYVTGAVGQLSDASK